MQLTITARHFELTNAIRDYIEKACDKLTRYFDQIINVHFVLELQNNRNFAEMKLHASHFNLQSQSEEHDMYLSIDSTIDKMESQVKKLKDKITDHQRKKSLKANTHFVYDNLFEKGEPKKNKRMLKTKRTIAEPMTTSEAIDRCVESEKEFYIFKNVETDRINVVVQKDPQHFRLLEP